MLKYRLCEGDCEAAAQCVGTADPRAQAMGSREHASQSSKRAPHVYDVARRAFQSMLSTGKVSTVVGSECV
jgi:hypothetical protein